MATKDHDPPAAPGRPRASDPGTPASAAGYSLPVYRHPSLAPVPAHERVLKTAAVKKIIVVDDEPDQVDLAVMALEAAGHEAHGTTDSPATLGLVLKHVADLLVVDFMMPKMSGGEVGRMLRAHPTARQIKIVMMSGTPEEDVRADFDKFEV